MAISKARKNEAFQAILKHLQVKGSADWPEVIERFPDVSPATFWRMVKSAKEVTPEKGAMAGAQMRLMKKSKLSGVAIPEPEVPADASPLVAKTARHLPAAPRPEYLAKAGPAAMQHLDFAAEIQLLYSDAMMLRAYSVKTDEAGAESIKNPVLFEKQINRRTALIETGIRTIQELWDLRTMQGFYETIIEEIGKESPAAQRRILDRLQELNNNRGMTMFAKF